MVKILGTYGENYFKVVVKVVDVFTVTSRRVVNQILNIISWTTHGFFNIPFMGEGTCSVIKHSYIL
jgi:hypothetical protein